VGLRCLKRIRIEWQLVHGQRGDNAAQSKVLKGNFGTSLQKKSTEGMAGTHGSANIIMGKPMSTHRNGSGVMQIFGVASQDRVFFDGSNHQYTGRIRKAVFTIGISKDRLDAPIKRVGFMGIDNDRPMQIEDPPTAVYNHDLWDLTFELHVSIVWEQRFHRIKGSFYVETTNNTYYWLKNKGMTDFEFDGNSRFMLTDYGDVVALGRSA
jgi:hypothetical protein